MTLSSRQIRLEFRSDSKRSVLNDVVVWLCRNPIAQNDDLLIAQQDIDKVLDPLWTPTRLPRGKRIRVLAFGAGHGGKDPGKQVGARKEKDFTLRLASELETLARKQGFGVIQVRDKDEFIDLLDRPAIARKRGADLYVSLHFNSFTGPGSDTAKGLEVYCMTPAGASSTNDSGGTPMPGMTSNKYDHENILLAYQLQRAILSKSNLDDRGVKRARFLELTQMSMPAALVEGGFMTHPGDARLIFDPKERKRLADGILDGIHAYKGLVERS